jgi:sialate O-acetylesterase
VTVDISNPNNIHPSDKQDVGYRLALAARATVYGEHVEYSGPEYRAVSRDGSRLCLYFDHAEGGLVVRGSQPLGFEIAGKDGHFFPATARVEDTTVVLSSSRVAHPTQARYGWANAPQCNLFNHAGLPASPFRARLP